MQSMAGGFMVAFAGRQYAARSVPVFVADNTHTITSFTLVRPFGLNVQELRYLDSSIFPKYPCPMNMTWVWVWNMCLSY